MRPQLPMPQQQQLHRMEQQPLLAVLWSFAKTFFFCCLIYTFNPNRLFDSLWLCFSKRLRISANDSAFFFISINTLNNLQGSDVPPFVCFFHFFRLGDSLAAASDPLWVFHENFDPPAPKYTHTTTPRQNATHSHFHTFTEQHSPLVPSSSKRFFFCWLRQLSAHVRSRAESSNNNNNDGDDDGKMAAKFGIQKRFPRCRLASSHCFFFFAQLFRST